MTKPFGVGELQARLRVLMRRYPGSEKMIPFMSSGISVWILRASGQERRGGSASHTD